MGNMDIQYNGLAGAEVFNGWGIWATGDTRPVGDEKGSIPSAAAQRLVESGCFRFVATTTDRHGVVPQIDDFDSSGEK